MNATSVFSAPATNEAPGFLSLAALFEENFSIDWLVQLTQKKASQILGVLEAGIQEGWLARKEPGVFSFTDPKQKEIFLGYLPSGERARLHRDVAQLLHRDLGDEPLKVAAATHHLLNITNDVETCRWLMRAGDFHLGAFRTELALQCYTKILNDLSSFSGEEVDRLFIEVAIKYSKISTARLPTKEVIAILRDARRRAEKWQEKGFQSLLEMHLAKNEWLSSRYRSALKHFEFGWSLAKEIDDFKVLRSITTFSTFFLYWQGRFREAVRNYEKYVSDVGKFPRSRFPLLVGSTIGQCYAYIGQPTQGLGMLDAIRLHCLEKGDRFLAANAEGTMGDILLDMRHMGDALRYLESAEEKANQEKNYLVQILVKLTMAYAYYLLEEKDRSIRYLQEFLEQSKRVKMTVQLYPYLIELCWGMEEGKLPRISGLSLQKEVRRSIAGGNVFMKGVAYRYLALLQRRENGSSELIFQSLKHSLKWLEESGHQIEIAKSKFELARQHLICQQEEKAREAARAAHKILSAFGESLTPHEFLFLLEDHNVKEDIPKEIVKLAQEIVSIRDNKDLIQHILSTGNKITGAERGAIFFLEEKAESARPILRASRNLTSEEINHPSFSSSMRMIQEVAETGKARIRGVDLEEMASISQDVIRSRICVPMILREEVVGVLYHDNRLLMSAFRETDLGLLAYFGALAGFALDNARAYEEIQRLNQKISEEKKYYEEQHRQSIHFESIVGESPAIRGVLDQVAQVASTESTVLIAGETGVGKELVARAIHNHSLRRNKAFIQVHCSSLPESLIPSELFGHEKGAFTGATHRRVGRFELADGGTIFLDEIGDLSLDVQVRLLRVLQSKEFERVGGSETLRSDFRLVAATHRNLEELVRLERFRADLYYRLNVFPIYVPPLRERKDDIPLLACYFLKNYGRKMGKPFEGIAEEEMDKLLGYGWPGNVRELENVIERGTILSSLPHFRVPELYSFRLEGTSPQEGISLKDNERRHILWGLQKTRWKVRGPGGAAELLNIHPSTLEFRIKKLGIRRPLRNGKDRGESWEKGAEINKQE